MENIDALKSNPAQRGRLAYRLKNANVYVSENGFHCIDYLDPVEEISPEIDASQLTVEVAAYIETQLQANAKKFENQANIVKEHLAQSIVVSQTPTNVCSWVSYPQTNYHEQ
ncbi:MAG: hypothetical protein DCC56_10320 [Anaerolineae bacterium]|nr:MAG: hypothetical protein DCC56_10320 [Anaerolineae bacterium]